MTAWRLTLTDEECDSLEREARWHPEKPHYHSRAAFAIGLSRGLQRAAEMLKDHIRPPSALISNQESHVNGLLNSAIKETIAAIDREREGGDDGKR